MDSLYIIIPIALAFLVLAIKILFWAINNGQYDDLDTEAQRILFDEDSVQKKTLDSSGVSAKETDSTTSTESRNR